MAAARSRSAPGRSTANSSPPIRATMSSARTEWRSAAPAAWMTWSPTWWPSVSLTALKWSRSISITAPEACACSSSAPSRRWKPRRFSSSVSVSCSAWWRSSTSRPRRSETSMTCVSSGPSLSRVKCICAQRASPSAVSRRTSRADRDAGRRRARGPSARPRARGRPGARGRPRCARPAPPPRGRDRAQRRVDAVEDAGARGEALARRARPRTRPRSGPRPTASRRRVRGRVLQHDRRAPSAARRARTRAARSAARGAARRRRPRRPGRRRRRASARRLAARCPACRAPRRGWSRAARRCGAARRRTAPTSTLSRNAPETTPASRSRLDTRGRSRAARARRWSSA